MKKIITLLILMVMFFTPINIKAEVDTSIVEGTTTVSYTPNKKVINIDKGHPSTNDNSNFGSLYIVIVSSMILFIILLIVKKKKTNEDEIL